MSGTICAFIVWMSIVSGSSVVGMAALDTFMDLASCNRAAGILNADAKKASPREFLYACFPSDFDPRTK